MTIELLTKCCTRCHETKPITDFYRHKGTKDGFYSCCKTCHRASSQASQSRRREAMGEEAWLEHQRSIVARSRARREMSTERTYRRAYGAAVQRLINAHRAEFQHLLLLARRGELEATG